MQLEELSNISDNLAMMGDPALQQFAQMHKNDPYMVSLALSESNRRKKLRTAAQGQAGATPQPKVVDAAIQGMTPAPAPVAQTRLPEDQGIAQIPTPNMRRLADGGIAGYEDDEEGMATGGMGGMFNFAQQSEPVVRMAGGGHVPRYQGNTRDGSVVGGIPGFQAVQPRAEFTQQGAPENTPFLQRIMESLSSSNKERQLAMIEQKIMQGIATPEEIAVYQEAKVKAGDKAAIDAKYPPQDAIRTKDFPGVKPGFEKMPVDAGAAPPPPPGAKPAPQVKLPTGIATLKEPTAADAKAKATEFYNSADQTRRLEQQQLQERQDILGQKEARIEQLAAFNEKQGPAYAGYEKLLKSEELQDTTDKEKAGLMSLMKGFLAMAAGESPNAATNIAKGAMVGLGDYGDALKEFKKAAKERNKAMADIENARRAEAKGDLKDTQMYEEKADTRLTESNRLFTSAVMQVTGKEADISSSIFGKMVDNAEATKRTMLQEAGANARTMAQLNAPDAQSKFYGNLGGGDVKKGLGFYAETMGPDAKGLQAILKDYSGMVGEARLKAMETSQDPAERSKAATIRQLQKEQLVGGIKPVNVAQDRNLLP